MGPELERLVEDILCGGTHYLGGVQNRSDSLPSLFSAVVQWSMAVKKDLNEVVAVVEPCIRQSILMSLLPAEALDPAFQGSIDVSVDNHLRALGIQVSSRGRLILRDACINARRLYGMNAKQSRQQSASIAQLRGNQGLYREILARQKNRCVWCGVSLTAPFVVQTLDHVTPKHLGDDHSDGRNWAVTCRSCNTGKGDCLAWASRPEAHDFLGRNDIATTQIIGLTHRWSVLMRERGCEYCKMTTAAAELWVYRRIKTGLPVPVNCGATCEDCAEKRTLEILRPNWDLKEVGRAVLVV